MDCHGWLIASLPNGSTIAAVVSGRVSLIKQILIHAGHYYTLDPTIQTSKGSLDSLGVDNSIYLQYVSEIN